MFEIKINNHKFDNENIFIDTNILIFYAKYINSEYKTIKNENKRKIKYLKIRIENCKTEIRYLNKTHKKLIEEFGIKQIEQFNDEIKQIEILYDNLFNEGKYSEYEISHLEDKNTEFNKKIKSLEGKNINELKNQHNLHNIEIQRKIISKYIIENYNDKIKLTPMVFDEYKYINNGIKPPISERLIQKFVKMLVSYNELKEINNLELKKANDIKLDEMEKIYMIDNIQNEFNNTDNVILMNQYNSEEYQNKRKERAKNWIFKKRYSLLNDRNGKFIEFIDDKYIKKFNMNLEDRKIEISKYEEKINTYYSFIKNLKKASNNINEFEISDEQIELAIEYLQYNVKDDIKILDFVGRYSESHLNTILITNDSDIILFHEEIEKIYTNLKIISLSDISIKNN